jgi:hypothetical protein
VAAMKTVFITLGVIFLILIVLVAGFVGYAAYVGTKLDASSKAYVDASVPAIISTWSKDELKKRASPQLLKSASDEQIDDLFTRLAAQLGSFQSYDGSKGDSNVSYTTQDGKVISASYTANATFQNGKIDIQVKLIQINSDWFLLGFHVEPHSAN